MSPPESLSQDDDFNAGLPTKITVIVFWGMVWIGIAFSIILLKNLDKQLADHYVSSSEQFYSGLSTLLRERPGLSPAALETTVAGLSRKYGIAGIKVDLGKQVIQTGSTSPDMFINKRELTVRADGKNWKSVTINTFHPNLKQAIFDTQRNLLVSMGLSVLLYGLVLVWILKHVLTKPFESMISTAQAVSKGNVQSRFDEERQDEFGYLARFVNKIMDKLLVKQSELFEEKERAEVTLHSIGDAVITTDRDGHITYLNPVAEQLTGWVENEIKNQQLSEVMKIIDDRTRMPVRNPVDECLKTGKAVELADNTVLIRQNGQEIAIADSAAPIRNRLGKVIGTVMVFHDVSEARKLQHQLSFQASHDALTGLYNRREFENNLEYSLLESRRDSSHHCLCYLDLDQFKLVNDTCGHVAGDELLIQLSTLLKEHVRDSDMLARLGGDEFGILFNYCSMKDARKATGKLLTSINNFRFVWQEHSFDVGASIGVVAVNRGSRSIADILSAADVACYAAKDAGRNRVHIYEPDDEELKQRHGEMRWVSRIKAALASDRFILYYQPIEPINGQPHGHKRFEILVRMLGSSEEIIPPMAFIPAAERYGLMSEIDRWVIRNTLDALAHKPDSEEKWNCSINLSGQSLSEEGFLEFILEELEGSDIDPGCICFEITETAAIANLNNAVKFISTLKETGCSFSLDDFGSGLSSFAYLKNLKVDFLKIDGGFVKNMVTDPINNAMVEAINDIGHVMNIQTVAEFAENEEIINALKDLGVDFAQGYGIEIPRPLEELSNITPSKKNLAS